MHVCLRFRFLFNRVPYFFSRPMACLHWGKVTLALGLRRTFVLFSSTLAKKIEKETNLALERLGIPYLHVNREKKKQSNVLHFSRFSRVFSIQYNLLVDGVHLMGKIEGDLALGGYTYIFVNVIEKVNTEFVILTRTTFIYL
jgi:hypothetical protein